MVYSDFYKVIISLSNSKKDFIEIAKAWLADKDIDEGKMWYYYIFIMCDKLREEIFCHEYEDEDDDDEDEYEERYHTSRTKAKQYKHEDEDEDDEKKEAYRKPVRVRYLSRY